MKQFLGPFIFALIAAIGNAFFALGQKKAGTSGHPVLFMVFTLLVSIASVLSLSWMFPKMELSKFLQFNYKWFTISGIGFTATFLGFYFLFNKYGTSYYTLYAVLSILTTSILVGLVFFREDFNWYYAMAILTALSTIFFFYLGSTKTGNG